MNGTHERETAARVVPSDGQQYQTPSQYDEAARIVKAATAAVVRRGLALCETCGWPMVTPAARCRKCAGPLCADRRDVGYGYCAPCLFAFQEEDAR